MILECEVEILNIDSHLCGCPWTSRIGCDLKPVWTKLHQFVKKFVGRLYQTQACVWWSCRLGTKWRNVRDIIGRTFVSRYISLVQIVIFLRQLRVTTKVLRVLLNLVRASVVVIGVQPTVFGLLSGRPELWRLFDLSKHRRWTFSDFVVTFICTLVLINDTVIFRANFSPCWDVPGFG